MVDLDTKCFNSNHFSKSQTDKQICEQYPDPHQLKNLFTQKPHAETGFQNFHIGHLIL